MLGCVGARSSAMNTHLFLAYRFYQCPLPQHCTMSLYDDPTCNPPFLTFPCQFRCVYLRFSPSWIPFKFTIFSILVPPVCCTMMFWHPNALPSHCVFIFWMWRRVSGKSLADVHPRSPHRRHV
ncbi:hypothetical protein NEOLEDRAFT_342742 [Neolentinus lepideus HHB14362 ss-1]|uniref:Uncharacterized protein n=1 Tax=Neolentinus lepideus HHB14362 ss-1 TaxID=1314782 RepID=A0A165M5X3_9AGAM|nr:hypothetical protein NEOLEDRAFT_342742 [Neolentinus lepideus HHB14362 ss-1]